MDSSREYVVAFDVSENGERRRVNKVLKRHGIRVQKSVFEVRMTKGVRQRLLHDLNSLDLATGFVLVYRLQANGKREVVGAPPEDLHDESRPAFVV